jgi:nucleotide-binding universal stress UspA family protein
MKAILAPVEPHPFIRSVLDAALSVASRFGSHVEGLALGPDIPDVVAFDVPAVWTVLSEKEQRELFEEFMLSCSVPRKSEAPDEVSCGWLGHQLYGDRYIGSFSRVFDLVVLGQPARHDEPPRQATLEAALFEGGRPVLMVPPSSPASIGETIVIAWNGSTETARTVALSLPILEKAGRVIVLTLEGWSMEGPSGAELALRLGRKGIAVETVTRRLNMRSPGEAILEDATALHADLVVKGAYTQSRLRQLIFGGATSHIITHAELPVLLAH